MSRAYLVVIGLVATLLLSVGSCGFMKRIDSNAQMLNVSDADTLASTLTALSK